MCTYSKTISNKSSKISSVIFKSSGFPSYFFVLVVVVLVVVVVVGCVASAVLKMHDSQATTFGSRCFSTNHYVIFRLVSDFRGLF